MIRKPEAKNQAELLVKELATQGITVARGIALNIVAKQQGFRGWNEFCAAEKAPAKAASGKSLCYQIGDISHLSPSSEVSDYHLAAYLQHGTRDQTSTLLTWVSEGGDEYELRLCGQTRIEVRSGSDVREIRSADGVASTFNAALSVLAQGQPLSLECLDSPFFEWLDEIGDPVGDVMSTISVRPEDEIAALKEMLGVAMNNEATS